MPKLALVWLFVLFASVNMPGMAAPGQETYKPIKIGGVTLRIGLFPHPAGRELRLIDGADKDRFPRGFLVDRDQQVALGSGGQKIFLVSAGRGVNGYWFQWQGQRYQHVRTDIADLVLRSDQCRAGDARIHAAFARPTRFREALRRCQAAVDRHPRFRGQTLRSTAFRSGESGPEFQLRGGWRVQAVWNPRSRKWRQVSFLAPIPHQ